MYRKRTSMKYDFRTVRRVSVRTDPQAPGSGKQVNKNPKEKILRFLRKIIGVCVFHFKSIL